MPLALPSRQAIWGLLPLFLAILLYSELGENLWRTKGHYHARRFTYLLIAWLLFWSFTSFKKIKIEIDKYDALDLCHRAIYFVLAYFFYKTMRDPKVIYAQSEGLIIFFKGVSGIGLFSCLSLFFGKRLTNPFYLLSFLLGLVFLNKLLVLIASPNPIIDVFTSNTDGAKYLLSGTNPYGAEYRDIYGGKYDYKPGYVYWPTVLYLQTMSFKLFNDIRYAHFFCDLLTAIGLFKIFSKTTRKRAAVILLLWFGLPTQNFIIEQAWIDPILVTMTVWTFYGLKKENYLLAGLFLGAAVATKQYAGVMAIVIGFSILFHRGLKETFQLTGVSLASFFLIMAPMVFWNPEAFYQMTMKVPLAQEFRYDSFSLVAIMIREWGLAPSAWLFSVPPLLGLGVSIAMVKRNPGLRGLALGLTFCFSLVFFFGKQAFCNYYYYLSFFLLLTIGWSLERLTEQNETL